MNLISRKFPRLVAALRPTLDEIDFYAQIILQHEGRPASALADCRREAELQLWVDRSLRPRGGRRSGSRPPMGG